VTAFLDASAIVALIAGEPGADRIANRMEAEESLLSSPLARWESVIALKRSHRYEWHVAQAHVDALFRDRKVAIVPIDDLTGQSALSIWAVYGKGNHPAGLNLADCFAAACADRHAAWLIFKGEDFSRTELSWIDRA